MASELVMFSEAAAQAGPATIRDEPQAKQSFGKRQTTARPEPVAEDYVAPSDRALAIRITQAISCLQDAMDSAIRAGLMVEPAFRTVSGRFNEFGVSVDSHICTVQIYRKLA